jgi:hypothetical protein
MTSAEDAAYLAAVENAIAQVDVSWATVPQIAKQVPAVSARVVGRKLAQLHTRGRLDRAMHERKFRYRAVDTPTGQEG